MRATIYLPIGSTCGPFEVLRLNTDSVNCRYRTYDVRAKCCGDEMVRSHRVLIESERLARTMCARCAQYQVQETGTKDNSKPFMAAMAELPHGILSAAVAWPRPGARA